MLYNARIQKRKTASQIESEELQAQREDREFLQAMEFLKQSVSDDAEVLGRAADDSEEEE